jgi:hypothetical protein
MAVPRLCPLWDGWTHITSKTLSLGLTMEVAMSMPSKVNIMAPPLRAAVINNCLPMNVGCLPTFRIFLTREYSSVVHWWTKKDCAQQHVGLRISSIYN